jgi:hypothetical protein
MQNHCAEIKLRAERKAGDLLKKQKETGERDAGMGGDRKSQSSTTTVKSNLKNLGITKDQSSQWQTIASLPEEVFEEHIEETKTKKKELTTANMVKLAKKEKKLRKAGEDWPATG